MHDAAVTSGLNAILILVAQVAVGGLSRQTRQLCRLLMFVVVFVTALAVAAPVLAGPPPSAARPIETRWMDVTVVKGTGMSWACVDVWSNPFGYYTTYEVLWGRYYVDANGTWYTAWYGPYGQIGPADVDQAYSWVNCGLPGA